MKFYRFFGKRILDIVMSTILIILCSPLILVAALALAIANRGNILFIQDRPGLHEELFRILKFKTMRDAFASDGKPLPDEERLTAMGRIIRRFSLDELLQLINVLKGEMSLIGPRPLLVEYLPIYSPHQRRRHEVLPGITGLAQVMGRNLLSWEEKFNYDVQYVETMSFQLDIWILVQTIKAVITSRGIMSNTGASMPRFAGSDSSTKVNS